MGMMREELDIVSMLKTIKKLEAGVAVLIRENCAKERLIKKAKELYLNSCTISVHNEEISADSCNHDYLFWHFCEENDDNIIKDQLVIASNL